MIDRPSEDEKPPTRRFALCALAALLLYGWWLAARFSPVPGGADASGYLHSARLLAEGRLTTTLRTLPELRGASPYDFQPLGFIAEDNSPLLRPTYPVGLPLHLTAACAVAGWRWGPVIVGIGAALAAVVFCYLLARELAVSRALATAAAGSLAVCAVFVFSSVQPLSDTLAAAWCMAAMFAAWRARRGSLAWAAGCGAACVVAVAVRPTNVLLLPALALALGHWKKFGAAALGALPGALLLGVYQHRLYGSALRTGYGSVSDLFATRYFWPTLAHFAYWLARLLPLAWVALPALVVAPWRERGRELAALVVWGTAFVLFYAFYSVSHENWSCLRFIAPALPAWLMLAVVGLETLAVHRAEPRRNFFRTSFATAALLAGLAGNVLFGFPNLQRHDRMYVAAIAWVRETVPPDAVIVSGVFSGTLYYETELPVLRWDSVPPDIAAKYFAALARSHRPIFAILELTEITDPRLKRIPVRWTKLADFDRASAWRITPASAGP